MKMTRGLVIAAALITLTMTACWAAWPKEIPVVRPRVVATFPHDENAFSQGLTFFEGRLFESTGQYRESSVREVDLKTGKVLQVLNLNDDYFGEGLAVIDSRLVQITWRNHLALVFEPSPLKYVGNYSYAGEGWGLASNGKQVYMSDGSSMLQELNPKTFAVVRKVPVKAKGRSVGELNELEFVGDELWANIWHSDRIARINPQTGEITGWLDLSGLYPARERRDRENVLNGIAWNPETKAIYVTGKNWPKLFQIELPE